MNFYSFYNLSILSILSLIISSLFLFICLYVSIYLYICAFLYLDCLKLLILSWSMLFMLSNVFIYWHENTKIIKRLKSRSNFRALVFRKSLSIKINKQLLKQSSKDNKYDSDFSLIQRDAKLSKVKFLFPWILFSTKRKLLQGIRLGELFLLASYEFNFSATFVNKTHEESLDFYKLF